MKLVPLLQAQGPDTALPGGVDALEGDALHGAHPGGHHQVLVRLLQAPDVEHGGDALPVLQGEHIDDGGTLGGAAGLGDPIALEPVHLADVGEEQNEIVGGGGEEALHIVLLLQGLGVDPLAAPALGPVGADRGAFDIATLGQGKDALLLLDQVLDVQVVLHIHDLGAAVVPVLVPDGDELVLQHALQHALVAQELVIVGDALLQLLIFVRGASPPPDPGAASAACPGWPGPGCRPARTGPSDFPWRRRSSPG